MPVTVDGLWLEGEHDRLTLVVALTHGDRPEVRYELRTQLSDWDFVAGEGWAVWLQEAIVEAVDAAPGLPAATQPGTVVVDLDRR